MVVEWKFAPIFRDVGVVLRWFALVMITPTVISLIWQEWYAIPGFLASAALTYILGRGVGRLGSTAEQSNLIEAFVSAAIVWFTVAAVSSLPFLIIAWIVVLDPVLMDTPSLSSTLGVFRWPANAFFEGMSGITGTGLTMAVREPHLPATLLWWRTTLEWVGGLGIVVLTVSILGDSGEDPLSYFYKEESPLGQVEDEPATPTVMLAVFLALTGGAVAILWVAGMPLWEALNHGMTGISTGGFTVTDSSIASYSPLVDIVLIPVMILGAIPFPVYYVAYQGQPWEFLSDLQTRVLYKSIVAGSVIIGGFLVAYSTYTSVATNLLYGIFQFVSAISCTGFMNTTAIGNQWPTEALLVLVIAMVVGGAAGSTASGIKILRAISLTSGSWSRVNAVFFKPRSHRLDTDEGRIISRHASTTYDEAAFISFLWVVFLIGGVFVLLWTLPTTTSLSRVLFEVASAQGNVGITTGITGPRMPLAAKIGFIFNMWLGRLEIVPVLTLFQGIGQTFKDAA